MPNQTKPSTYINWTDGSGTKVSQPPSSKMLSGWTSGEVPPFQYMNWLFFQLDQWIQYLDQTLNLDASDVNVNASMRLINGGSWSFNASTGVLTWSSAFNLAVPGIADANNQAAASSVTLTDGQVAYVNSNIPFVTTGNTTIGSNQITNVSYTDGISVGQTVTGTGIPGSTTVTAIDTTNNIVTISNNATATGSPSLTFSGTSALTVTAATSSSLAITPNRVILARRVGSLVFIGVNSSQMVLRDGESKLLNQVGYDMVISVTAGENLTAGQAVYISPGTGIDSGRTAGSAYKTDAGSTNGSIRSAFVGLVVTTVTAGSTATIISSGIYPNLSSLTQGALYYLDPATTGGITSTRPLVTNQYLCPIGTAQNTTTLLIEPTASAPIVSSKNASPYDALNYSLAVSASGGSLTVALKDASGADPSSSSPVQFSMRSPTATSSLYNSRSVTAALSMSLSFATTLGMLASQNNYLWIYAVDSDGSGTMKLAASTIRLDEGSLQSVVPETQNFTVTIASPAVFTVANHGLQNNDAIRLLTTGALPTGLSTITTYYVINATTNTFQVSTVPGGTAVNTSGTQSGTHTLSVANFNLVSNAAYTNAPIKLIGRLQFNLGTSGTWLAPTEVAMPFSIQNGETVGFHYKGPGGVAFTSGTVWDYSLGTRVVDTHGLYSVGYFVAPKSGFYSFACSMDNYSSGVQPFVNRNGYSYTGNLTGAMWGTIYMNKRDLLSAAPMGGGTGSSSTTLERVFIEVAHIR